MTNSAGSEKRRGARIASLIIKAATSCGIREPACPQCPSSQSHISRHCAPLPGLRHPPSSPPQRAFDNCRGQCRGGASYSSRKNLAGRTPHEALPPCSLRRRLRRHRRAARARPRRHVESHLRRVLSLRQSQYGGDHHVAARVFGIPPSR
jgi:hypothetical protein